MIVLDASVTLAWLHRDEQTPAINAIARQVQLEGAIVPSIWISEIPNGLLMAMRRQRITEAGMAEALSTLRRLRIEIDHTGHETAWINVMPRAVRYNLTVYDATYLELAIRKRLPLATLDDKLIAAARAEGLTVLP